MAVAGVVDDRSSGPVTDGDRMSASSACHGGFGYKWLIIKKKRYFKRKLNIWGMDKRYEAAMG
jgi:hypothetical protein